MTATQYQDEITPLIRTKLGGVEVNSEWRAFQGIPYLYSPRVDIAVGPYSIISGQNKIREYDELLTKVNIKFFLQKIYNYHIENIGDEWMNEIDIPDLDFLVRKNENARCFLAIEIENTSTKKHIMGSMINAASLGRIGIGVAFNDSVKRTFVRQLNYLAFLKRVEKNSYDTTNFLIITKNQLENILNTDND